MTWSYDAANQLLAENRTGTTPYINTFSYDPAQNRLTKNESSSLTTYSYDVANQLETALDASGTTTYTFDDNGNQQIVQSPNGDRTTTTWDYENQPTVVAKLDATRVTAVYTADNRRVEKQTSTASDRFVWDTETDAYLLETNDSDITQVVYTNEPIQFGKLISQRRSSATYWHLFDALGSTRELADASQIIIDTILYDSWGNVLSTTGSTANPFLYVGELGYYYDTVTDANYVRARVYDPASARWHSADPLRIEVVRSLYFYGNNNAMRAVDPSGYFAEPAVAIRPLSYLDELVSHLNDDGYSARQKATVDLQAALLRRDPRNARAYCKSQLSKTSVSEVIYRLGIACKQSFELYRLSIVGGRHQLSFCCSSDGYDVLKKIDGGLSSLEATLQAINSDLAHINTIRSFLKTTYILDVNPPFTTEEVGAPHLFSRFSLANSIARNCKRCKLVFLPTTLPGYRALGPNFHWAMFGAPEYTDNDCPPVDAPKPR